MSTPPEASPGPRRRRLPWILLGVVLLLAAAAWALQTRWAFRTVLVPLADRLLPGDLAADDGRFAWSGGLELSGARYREAPSTPDGDGLAVEVGQLRLAIAPLSLVGGGRPVLRDLSARGVHVHAPLGAEDAGAPPSAAEPGSPSSLRLPLVVERADVEDVTVELARGGSPVWRIGPVALKVSGLEPAGEGRIDLAVPLAWWPAESPPRAGEVALEGTLREAAGDEKAPLRAALEVRGRLDETPPDAVDPAAAFRLEASLDGTLAQDGALEVARAVVALSGDATKIVQAEISGTAHLRKESAELAVALETPEVSPALARLGAAPPEPWASLLAATRLEGDLVLARQGPDDGARVTGALALRGASLPAAQGRETLDVLLRPDVHSGPSFDRFELAATELTLQDPAGGPRGRLQGEGTVDLRSGSDDPVVDVALTLDAAALAPWWAVFDEGASFALGPLPASGDLRLRVERDGRFAAEGKPRVTVQRPAPEAGAEQPAPVEMALEGRVASLEADGIEFDLSAAAPGADGGSGRLEARGTFVSGSAPRLALKGKVDSVDLTLWAPLWSVGREDAAAGEAEDGGSTAAGSVGPPLGLDVDVEIGALRLRDLEVRESRLTAERSGAAFRYTLTPTRIGEGSLEGAVVRRFEDDGQHVAWNLRADAVDLRQTLESLAPGSAGLLDGRLELESRGGGTVEADADPWDAVDGTLYFRIHEGRAADFPLQRFLVKVVNVAQFLSIDLDGTGGEFPVRDGVVRLKNLVVGSPAVHVVVGGDVGPEGVDLKINPRLGPNLASDYAGPFVGGLLRTTAGLTALPVVVTVKGPYGALKRGWRPATPAVISGVFGGAWSAVTAAGAAVGLGNGEADSTTPTVRPGAAPPPTPAPLDAAPASPVSSEPPGAVAPEPSAAAEPAPGAPASPPGAGVEPPPDAPGPGPEAVAAP